MARATGQCQPCQHAGTALHETAPHAARCTCEPRPASMHAWPTRLHCKLLHSRPCARPPARLLPGALPCPAPAPGLCNLSPLPQAPPSSVLPLPCVRACLHQTPEGPAPCSPLPNPPARCPAALACPACAAAPSRRALCARWPACAGGRPLPRCAAAARPTVWLLGPRPRTGGGQPHACAARQPVRSAALQPAVSAKLPSCTAVRWWQAPAAVIRAGLPQACGDP